MIDCRKCISNEVAIKSHPQFDLCRNPETSKYSEHARKYECKPEAKFFEPIPPTAFRKLVDRILTRPPLPTVEFDFETKTPEMYQWQQQ
jgi:hypothetical protein